MKKLYLALLLCLVPSFVFALTANVSFTPPSNEDHMVVVLVSEISGDYGLGYGQRSEPGATSVKIGNIKPSTQYYFVAYQVDPDTWEKSSYSEEFPFMTEAYAEQTIVELPPMPLGGVVVTLTVQIEDM